MKNFKVGQKVVFVAKNLTPGSIDKNVIVPKDGDILTLSKKGEHENTWITKEYKGDEMFEQYFHESVLEPLQYKSANAEILEKFPLIEEKADVQIKEVPQKQIA